MVDWNENKNDDGPSTDNPGLFGWLFTIGIVFGAIAANVAVVLMVAQYSLTAAAAIALFTLVGWFAALLEL